MGTTALPKNVGIETMQITYTKENLILNIAYSDGIYRIDTPCWQFSDFEELKALFDCLPMPGNTEVEVKPQPQSVAKAPAPKKAPSPKKATAKPARKQPAKRIVWTEEQKKDIEERYKNGEGPSAIAKDYGCTANAIHQLRLRMGVERGKGKFDTPAEQEEREKKQKMALKAFRERQDLPWYLKDNSKRKSKD